MDNLSADMIQCKKDGFGCHYGKWKALQEEKKIARVEAEESEFVRQCKYCGKKFLIGKRGRLYCNTNCGAMATYYRNREKILARMRAKTLEKKGKVADGEG